MTPDHVRSLLAAHGIQTLVQPSPVRIFPDGDYETAGAKVVETLSDCSVVFGVKEMPARFFEREKTYVFFSHTIKGQSYNMTMLKKMMSLGCTLIDYEKITDKDDRRLLFFGRYAGLAGMIDSLWTLGKRLEKEEILNPFQQVKMTHEYASLEEAQAAVSSVAETIRRDGLNPEILPVVVGFTGYGHVSRGAQEIFDLLPHREIQPEEISRIMDKKPDDSKQALYKIVFKEEHMFRPVEPTASFGLQDYFNHPEKYRSVFETYIPNLTMVINAIYWTEKYPRLITKTYLKDLFEKNPSPRLKVIGDITCDIEGAIECTLKSTQPDAPVFTYDPSSGLAVDQFSDHGVTIMAVDNLPCELPRASSVDFGHILMKYVPEIATADYSVPFEQCRLPEPIKKSVILYGGQLTPSYEYMKKFL